MAAKAHGCRSGRVAIVIPAYNAERTLARVAEDIPRWLRASPHALYLVNDGSTDRTAECARTQVRRLVTDLRYLHRPVNRGYARAQKLAFSQALREDFEVIALLHADAQYPATSLPDLIAPLMDARADCVFGSRMASGVCAPLGGGMPLYKLVGNLVLTSMENAVFGMSLSEYHSGFVAYRRELLQRVPWKQLSNSFHFDGEMLLASHKLGFRISEIPIPTRYADEVSHLVPWKYLRSVLKVMWRECSGHYDSLLRSASQALPAPDYGPRSTRARLLEQFPEAAAKTSDGTASCETGVSGSVPWWTGDNDGATD